MIAPIILAAGIANLIMGNVILLASRNKKGLYPFVAISFMTFLWALCNFLMYKTDYTVFVRLAYTMGAVVMTFILVWAYTISAVKDKPKIVILVLIYIIGILFALLPILTNSVIYDLQKNALGGFDEKDGALFPLYAAYFLVTYCTVLMWLAKLYKQSGGNERKQSRLLLVGFSIYAGLSILFSFIMPLFGYKGLIDLDVPISIIFVAFTSYAITRYHFLDIRAVATNVLAIFLVLVLLVQLFFVYNFNDLLVRLSVLAAGIFIIWLWMRSYAKEMSLKQKIEKANTSLTHLADKLKQIHQSRTRFMADISHELKTPLTVLQGNLSLSLNKFDPESQRDLKHSIKRLTNLASDLLELARAESGILKVRKEEIIAREIFDEIKTETETLAKAKGVALNFNLRDNPRLSGDLGKLSKLALNLISNAIKHTPSGGQVLVKTAEDEHNFYFTVKDTGIGIPKEELLHIFQRFYRSRLVKGQKIEGTGLGLAICQWVVKAHQGEISVKSVEGKGSEFFVKLPKLTQG